MSEPPATAVADEPRLSPGSLLGRYEIIRRHDSGAMGHVYLARLCGAAQFEKLVVVKVAAQVQGQQDEASRRLLDEARLMSTLSHPNIAQVYDAGEHDGRPYFVMEYVRGPSLRQLLLECAKRGRGLSLDNALWIITNVAAALHYAHDKRTPDAAPAGIVHRDIAPQNILLSFDGGVKLVDFGVAKGAPGGSPTQPGTVEGNLRYMSPEQYLGAAVDRRSDVFSVGIVLFELTTGTRWLRERDDVKAAQAMLNGPLPRPSQRRAGYPPRLEQIVLRALRRAPHERFPDARTLQQELEDFASSEQLRLSNIELANTLHELFADDSTASTQGELARRLQPTAPGGASHVGVETPVRNPMDTRTRSHTLRLLSPEPSVAAPEPTTQLRLPRSGLTLLLTTQGSRRTGESSRRGRLRRALLALVLVLALAILVWAVLHSG